MDLSDFSTKEFLLNESFHRWILEPDDETRCFWENWLSAHPEKYEMVTEARMQIETIYHFFTGPQDAHACDVWRRINSSIEETDLETLHKSERR